MDLKVKLLAGAAVLAGAVTAIPASAQTGSQVETVVVTGVRASLESALAIKQNSTEIIDSIVATDIGKLPDQTVADALQRITGVQIMRDFGEGGAGQNAGSGIAIRGLSQVEMTVNGQEVLTASGVRTYDLEDMPSELVAGIDVYKTPSAHLDEGGLGGLINIRTLRPFDFDGAEVAAHADLNYGSLIDAVRPAGSVLLSDRWNTSIGEFGALIDFSYQDRAIRQDYASAGAPVVNDCTVINPSSATWPANTTVVNGTTTTTTSYSCTGTTTKVTTPSGTTSTTANAVAGTTLLYTPNGVYVPDYRATRARMGLNAAIQWQPISTLEFYAEANDSRLATYQNQPTYDAALSGSQAYSVLGSFTATSGTNFAASGSYGPLPAASNIVFTSIMGARDSTEYNQDYTIGGKWNATSDFIVTGSVNWQKSTYLLNVAYGYLYAPGETWTFNFSGKAPSNLMTAGPDLTAFASYVDYTPATTAGISYTQQNYHAQNIAEQMDAQWLTKLGPFNEFDFGVRYSDHDAIFNQTAGYTPSAPSATPNSSLYELVDTQNMSGVTNQVTKFWVFKPNLLRENYANEAALLGNTTYALPHFPTNPSSNLYSMSERLLSGYVEAKMDLGSLDGDFGIRFVNTNRSASGTITCAACTPVYSPVTYHLSHTDILPSVNLRFHFTDELQLRFAASRTMTRPNFSSMNPNTTLNLGSLSGSKGNINLPAMYSSNYDLSLEDYFSKTGSVYIAAFSKSVHNFPYSSSYPETIGGVAYTISESLASPAGGSIRGFELGYTQFYDFLPGLWKGLGLQANYTYVDSEQPYYIGNALAQTTTLPNLSKHSFNLIGMYELDPVSIRVAYTWRSSFLQSLYTGDNVGNVPVKEAGFGWLDASFTYNFTDQIAGYLQGQNLLNTMQHTYYGVSYSPANFYLNDRQIIIGVRYKM